jgi:hypothetical protein
MSQKKREKQRNERVAKQELLKQQNPQINIDELAINVAQKIPAQQQNPQINHDEIADKVAKRIPIQKQEPKINLEELVELLAQKIPTQQQNPQVNHDEIADKIAKKIPIQEQESKINIEELAELVAKKISNKNIANTDSFKVNYKEIAELILLDISKNQINLEQSNHKQNTSCSTQTEALSKILKSFNISFNKAKDIKADAEQLYTLYSELNLVENSYHVNAESADRYDNKAVIIKKSNKPLYTKLSSARDGILEVNTIMESSIGPIKAAIASIKSVMPKDFIDNFDQLAENLKDNSEITTNLNEYCNNCSNNLEKLTETEQLILFSACSVKIMLGLDSSIEIIDN